MVLEGESESEFGGKKVRVSDRIWLDPKIGFAPRRWERRADGILTDVRADSDFEEFAPGCWLPWECTWAHCAPDLGRGGVPGTARVHRPHAVAEGPCERRPGPSVQALTLGRGLSDA